MAVDRGKHPGIDGVAAGRTRACIGGAYDADAVHVVPGVRERTRFARRVRTIDPDLNVLVCRRSRRPVDLDMVAGVESSESSKSCRRQHSRRSGHCNRSSLEEPSGKHHIPVGSCQTLGRVGPIDQRVCVCVGCPICLGEKKLPSPRAYDTDSSDEELFLRLRLGRSVLGLDCRETAPGVVNEPAHFTAGFRGVKWSYNFRHDRYLRSDYTTISDESSMRAGKGESAENRE